MVDELHAVVLELVDDNNADNAVDEDTLMALNDAGPAEDIVDTQ